MKGSIAKYFCCKPSVVFFFYFVRFNRLFLLTRSNCRTLAFWLLTSHANAPTCKVAVNGARVCLVKNQVVVTEFVNGKAHYCKSN